MVRVLVCLALLASPLAHAKRAQGCEEKCDEIYELCNTECVKKAQKGLCKTACTKAVEPCRSQCKKAREKGK
jgi:hypothetical protein